MGATRLWEIGGFISGAILILFGVGALYLGINGYQTVGDELSKEQIVGGSDMAPAEIQKAASEAGLPDTIELPTCDVVDESIDTGSEARCFAQYMRVHALEATGGLSYAADGAVPVGRQPDDPAGTSDETAAAKDRAASRSRTARGTSGSTKRHSRPRSTSPTWRRRSRSSGSSSVSPSS